RAADDGVGAELARLGIGDVHRAALAAAVARLLAEELREHPVDRRPLGQAVTVAAMRARDEVVAAQGLADADRHGLLADVEVGQTRHLRALVELVHLLLEGANLRHLAVHVEVLLQLHPRFGCLGRHGRTSAPGPASSSQAFTVIASRRPPSLCAPHLYTASSSRATVMAASTRTRLSSEPSNRMKAPR